MSHAITPITIICKREAVLPNHMLDINATVKKRRFPKVKTKNTEKITAYRRLMPCKHYIISRNKLCRFWTAKETLINEHQRTSTQSKLGKSHQSLYGLSCKMWSLLLKWYERICCIVIRRIYVCYLFSSICLSLLSLCLGLDNVAMWLDW